ncbi:BCL2/adenovirus E1B 19 kDa protein-interacting protein 3-like [Styela clava]
MSTATNPSGRNKPSQNQESGMGDSWVTYNLDSLNSMQGLSQNEMEKLLREAQRESGQSSLAGSVKVGSSPPNTPCNSLQSTPGRSGEASPKNPANLQTIPELLSKTKDNADWVWDWSSTPETRPPKNTQFRRPKPRPMNLSIRKTSAMKSGYFSWDFLQVFIPSMIITNLVAFGFGVYIGKRVAINKTM